MRKSILTAVGLFAACQAHAIIYDVTVDGSDAIFLAGRTDLTIPDASDSWGGTDDKLLRHSSATPEETRETLPPSVVVTGGDVVRAADPAVGGINFFRGFGPSFFGPSGNGVAGSDLDSLGGISGYKGPEGPLTGLFLDANVPNGTAPAALDFSLSGLGTDFATLFPLLGQVFYIGDGVTSGGVFQEFIAPTGATRLFLGIPDGWGFDGAPGYYDDNDGSYRVRVGVNEIPSVPDSGSTIALLGFGFLAMIVARSRRN
tara:strand:- start:84 stop:857 length:774 start_codon:yes stop_codon:yes gene_type:complete